MLMWLAWRPFERVAWRDLPELAAYALFGVILNQLLFIRGLQLSNATNAVVLTSTIPVFTVGVALVLKREVATVAKLFGLGVACVGALVIVGAGRFEGGSARLIGNALIVINSLSFSIYLVISRRLLARYSSMTVVAWTFFFGALGVWPFGGAQLYATAPHLDARAWAAIAYIILFPTIGTYAGNMFALARAPSSVVAIYIYVQPVVGATLAAIVRGERPTLWTLSGGALIALGISLVNREAKRAREAAAERLRASS
jgi:drug/metabolite transporter (DMT)-like permease